MTRMIALCAASASLTLLCGCNFAPALLRVTEIHTETSGNGNTSRGTLEVTYDKDGRVEEMESQRNGDFSARHEYAYEEGRLVEIEILLDGSSPRVLEVEWTGNQLTSMSGTFDDYSEEIDFEYLDNDPNTLAEYRTEVRASNYTSRNELTFEYDDRRRFVGFQQESTAEIGGQALTPSTTELQLEYGDDGRPLTSEYRYQNGDSIDEVETDYLYDDRGRLEEVEDDDGTDIAITYDDAGRIIEIERRSGGTTTTAEYVYEDGSTGGFAFLLDGAGGLFDLTGRHLDRPVVYSTTFVPRP